MPYLSKEDQAKAGRRHYERNSAQIKARASVFKKQQIAKLMDIACKAKAVPCTDCGTSYPHYVMDFDHVEGKKQANVSDLIRSAVSVDTLLQEIQKCEVVCANCHRIRTWKDAAGGAHRVEDIGMRDGYLSKGNSAGNSGSASRVSRCHGRGDRAIRRRHPARPGTRHRRVSGTVRLSRRHAVRRQLQRLGYRRRPVPRSDLRSER